MKQIICLIIIALTIGLQSCTMDDEVEITVVNGMLINRITGEGVNGVPIVVVECASRYNQAPYCTFFKSIITKDGGLYSISFTHNSDKTYSLGIGENEWYTNSVTGYLTRGEGFYFLERNKTNNINMETTPYQILKVDIETSKEEKNFLHLKFRTKQENNASVEGTILIDTVSQHQMISTTRYIKVLPQRNYEISKIVCNRIGQQTPYTYNECVTDWTPSFYFPYQDTLSIKVK